MNLLDKTVVITGGCKGIGSALATEFAQKGSKIVIISENEENLKYKVSELGTTHTYYKADFTKPEELNALISNLQSDLEKIDILINNAGIGIYKNLTDITDEEWFNSLAINVTAPFMLTRDLMSLLAKSNAPLVVNIGSGTGKMPMPSRSAYCATKFALRGLSLSLSEEYKGSNVKFSLITLGSTLTGFGPLTQEQKLQKQQEGKNYFTPEWVAQKIVSTIVNDEIEDEVTLFPSSYISEFSQVT